MRISFFCALAAVVMLMLDTRVVTAGPEWVENDDAGGNGSNAQIVFGNGPLTKIRGRLGVSPLQGGTVDREDMYLVRIVDPARFLASTDVGFGGSADFDTQLWLFDFDPIRPNPFLGILGNDDVPGGESLQSLLLPNATDKSGAGIRVPGLYLIAICAFNDDPLSAGGEIFDQAVSTEISGPDGPGGAFSQQGWTGNSPGNEGDYQVFLEGVEFVSPCFEGDGDECLLPLSGCNGILEGDLADNTGSTGDDTSCAAGDTIDEWWCWVATCDGIATVTTCLPGTIFDTTLAAFDDCKGLELDCNDDTPGAPPACTLGPDGLNRKSTISFPVVRGQPYLIRVSVFGDDFFSQGGSGTLYEILFTCRSNCPTDIDGNGATDVDDLVQVILNWQSDRCLGNTDVNNDGMVDVDDLIAVILAWGPC